MNDKIRDEYELDFTVSGAEGAEKAIQGLQAAVDGLTRAGVIEAKQSQALSKALYRVEQSAGRSTGAVKRYSDSFSQLRREASQAERALQSAAQANVVRGGTNPLGYSANNMSLADAQRFNAINQASNLSLQQAAQERLRLEERLNAAKAQGAAEDQKLANLGRDKVAVAKENLALAQQELAAANSQKSSLGASGGKHGGGAATIADQVAAEERLANAKKGVTTAQRALNAATDQGQMSIAALRYANYDLATTYGIVAASIAGLGALTVSTFADMESGFTKVERTTGLYGAALNPVRDDLLELARVLPVTTNEIQDLAARGAQMGIAADNVADFAEVMAKFVATSPEVDVNSVAESFGRLANLTGTDDFEALASSIAQVGVNSAATDAQIIKTTQEMARATNATSLTAAEVIGLAAAFSSLGVAPEASRGIMNQFFTTIDKGAAGLNNSLAVAADIMGTTEAEATRLFKTDAGAFFQQFVTGLSGVENITVALDEMGLSGQRLVPAFQALAADASRNAAGQSVLASALRDANQGFAERTELERQYAPIADDMNSKMILLGNSFRELAYAVGTELAPALKGSMDLLTAVVQGITNFVESPVGGKITQMAAAFATLIGTYAALRSAIALASGSMLAFQMVAQAIKGTGLVASLQGLAAAFRGVAAGSGAAAAGVRGLNVALKTLGRITIIGAILYAVSELIFNTRDSLIWLGDTVVWLVNTVVAAFNKIGKVVGFAAEQVTGGVRDFGKSIRRLGESFPSMSDGAGEASNSMGEFAEALEAADVSQPDLTPTQDGLGGVADVAEEAAQKVYTLVDYANDLSSVWQRAFDIRFSGDQAADTIANSFQRLRDAAAESARKIRDLRNSMRSLSADIGSLKSDISILEHYLKIAREYGDTKRASALEAELAKKRAELAEKTTELANKSKELKSEQDSQSKSLTGNSQAARDNRKALMDLVQQYQAQIQALAASGLSQDELARRTDELKRQFIAQATQLGYNQKELGKYAAAFDDVRVAISKVPRKITVTANANPAIQALNEFNARARNTMAAAGTNAKNAFNNAIQGIGSTIPQTIPGTRVDYTRSFPTPYKSWEAFMSAARRAGWPFARLPGDYNMLASLGAGMGFAQGGFTGRGGVYDVAGPVHRGEYVIPKKDVNQSTGLPYADALGRLMSGAPSRSVAPASSAGTSGTQVVSLSAGTIQAIAQATGKAIYLDGRMIADASANVYAQQNTVGAF